MLRFTSLVLSITFLLSAESHAAPEKNAVKSAVDQSIQPLVEKYGIPGMAVGIVLNGETYIFDYGVASKKTGGPVTDQTLFELGSVSKTFTATLAEYAQENGRLSLVEPVSKYLPSLSGSHCGEVSLQNLGTHTGGLPARAPDNVTNNDQLTQYCRRWKPTDAPGTRRYSNLSIGILGVIAANSMKENFETLMSKSLLAGLHMKNTFLTVPKSQMGNYAQGYTQNDKPVRVTPGFLALEAYGIKATASDMVLFLKANMHLLEIDEKLQNALTKTHTGYYKVGAMTQDLIWEQYPYPGSLQDLMSGNSDMMSSHAYPATKLDPPLDPQENVLINKTGSTAGFATYTAFIPKKKIGIILLANKNYPKTARVAAAYEILERLTPLSY